MPPQKTNFLSPLLSSSQARAMPAEFSILRMKTTLKDAVSAFTIPRCDMPATPQPWTPVDEQLRQKILGTAQARGVSQRELAQAAGVNEVKLHRWTKKEAHLTERQLSKMAELIKAAPTRVDPALAQEAHAAQEGALPPGPATAVAVPEGVRRALDVLENLAGPTPAADEPSLRALARSHASAAIGTFVRLMVGAKSDSVKLHSAALLLERGFGRPLQAVVDLTPNPPAQDHDLLAIFQKIAGKEKATEVKQ